MGTDPGEQATASAGELAGRVGSHVGNVRQLLVPSQPAAQLDRYVARITAADDKAGTRPRRPA